MFALLIDETTDILIVKQLIIYGHYSFNGEARSRYLGIVELADGKAVTITDAILQFCSKMTLDIQRCLLPITALPIGWN